MRLRFSILGLVFLLGVSATVPAMGQTLEDVLTRHYESIGGLDAWRSIESLRWSGRMLMPTGMEAPFSMSFERPLKARLELTIQGTTGVQIYDGENAWAIMPFAGSDEPVMMPGEQAKLMREQADLDGPLVDWEQDGHQVEFVGETSISGSKSYQLRATLETGQVRDYFLDAETYLLTRQEATAMIQDDAVEIETTFGDYRKVGDLVIAHRIESKPKEAPTGQVLTIESVELNPALDESYFRMPETGAETPGGAAVE